MRKYVGGAKAPQRGRIETVKFEIGEQTRIFIFRESEYAHGWAVFYDVTPNEVYRAAARFYKARRPESVKQEFSIRDGIVLTFDYRR